MPLWQFALGIFFLMFSMFVMAFTPFKDLELAFMQAISVYRTEHLNQIAQALSILGGMPFVLFLCILWSISLLWYKKHIDIILIWTGILGGILLAWLLKFLIARPRPTEISHLVHSFGDSFPSAHSVYAGCLMLLLIYITQQHRWHKIIVCCALTWMLMMGISRVYLGVHYPSDVFAGWSISVIWITLLYQIYKRYNALYK
jgi:undecaprenyl-diphosphatase